MEGVGPHLLLVAGAGFLASAVNAVAGGGSLISFPTLIALGIPSKIANATNAFGLFPGSIGGALGLHDRFQHARQYLWPLMVASLIGSALGSWILIVTPQLTFDQIIPWLTLGATGLLAAQPGLKAWRDKKRSHPNLTVAVAIQTLVGLYGGFFGAGMGIMMLAAFGLFLDADIHDQNALKGWLAVGINLLASILFVVKRMVLWPEAIALIFGAVIGGYVAGSISKKVNPDVMRRIIVVYGVGMSLWLMARVYFGL